MAGDRLRALSRTAYTAAAGHLEVDPEPSADEPARVRWSVAPRVAIAAVVAVLLLAVALGVRAVAAAGSPDEVPVGWSSAADALADDGAEVDDADPGARPVGSPDDPAEADPSSAGTGPASPGAGADGAPDATAVVVVHVAGEVAKPGVVELPAGSRVHEAIDAAGGATAGADLAAVNLARVLVDGEQVYVPAPGEATPAVVQPDGGLADAAGARPIDLNAATAAELDALPGIGPVLAQRILDWRATHGRFSVVEELTEVAGIGPTLLERLRELVVV